MLWLFVHLYHKICDWWQGYKAELATEFYYQVHDLLENEKVLELDNYAQHHSYTRLQHSLDVAFISFSIASFLGWDARSTARGGLLHDFYLYDWRDDEYVSQGKNHAMHHPVVALENARKITVLNKKEENIIRRHMWLITLVPPRYKEGFIVTIVDKFCAMREFFVGVLNPDHPLRSVFAA